MISLKNIVLENQYNIQPTDRIIMARKDILPLKFPVVQNNWYAGKPNGLWYAIGTEWLDWIESEMPHWKGNVLYKIEINPQSMCMIKTKEQFLNFNKKYSESRKYGVSVSDKHKDINWGRVAEDYSGIEIAPYRSEFRHKYLWYYGWDVASGCIWKRDGVKNINKIKG